jgi:hypothetical protein
VTCEYSVYIISGAPTQTDTAVHKNMPESSNDLLIANELEDKAAELEDFLNEGQKFEPRPKGGSFSPVRNNEKDRHKMPSLPE